MQIAYHLFYGKELCGIIRDKVFTKTETFFWTELFHGLLDHLKLFLKIGNLLSLFSCLPFCISSKIRALRIQNKRTGKLWPLTLTWASKVTSKVKILWWKTHSEKSIHIWSLSLFSGIRTEYGALRNKSPYSIKTRENTDQKKTPFLGTFHAVTLGDRHLLSSLC